MASYWEMLGERVGYGLAAVVLGPVAALERRTRRTMRAAMLDSFEDLRPLRLERRRGTIRRNVQLPTGAGATSIDIDLDLHTHKTKLTLRLERLPSYVEARIQKHGSEFRLTTTSLDDDANHALVAMLTNGSLAGLDAIEIALSPEEVVIHITAPTTSEEWATIRAGLVDMVSWLAARWPASYR